MVDLKYLHGKIKYQKIIEQCLQNFKGKACLNNTITRQVIIQVQNDNTGIPDRDKSQRIG